MRPIPYGKQEIDRKDIDCVSQTLGSDWITQGPKIAEFERALCSYCGAKFAVAVSSGTAALHLACLAAGLKPQDEAITTPVTFAATANSVIYAGAKPVFADIQAADGNIDLREIEKKINRKTRAIIPVHYSGIPVDIPQLRKIAGKKTIIIEDACHALGAEYLHNGRWHKIGSCSHSDMCVFSFHPVKSITTGEGGAILTNNPALYRKLVLLRSHGITREGALFFSRNRASEKWYYEMQELGFNYRITDIQCALGISQLKKLDGFLSRRRAIALQYDTLFDADPEVSVLVPGRNVKSSYHLYVIKLANPCIRRKIFDALRAAGILVNVHYIPVHLHPYYRRKFGFCEGDFPRSEDFYSRIISLPIFPSMTKEQVFRVYKSLQCALKKIS